MADFPAGVYTPRTKENKPGVEYDAEQSTISFAEDITKLDDEVVAIETELGAEPKADFADVATHLVALGKSCITFIIDGGGSAITTGEKGHIEIPFKCEIERVTLLADQAGSVVIDIWKDTYANFPPTVADTITAAAKPTLDAALKYQDATLTAWTKAIAAGSILAFNVDSVATIERLTISIKIKKVA